MIVHTDECASLLYGEAGEVPGDMPCDCSCGYYVSAQDGQKTALLLGPFDSHDEALSHVENGRRLARQADDRAAFYAYGTAKITAETLPSGALNGRLT